MRRIVSWLCAAALLSMACIPVGAVSTSASSAILMDADSGRVLYEHNADEPRLIASVTKLLTALVAAERGPGLDEVVEVQAEWLSGVEGSSIYLQAGEKITMEALLYGDEGAEPVRQETKEEAVPEPEETVQGTPERPAGTAPGKQKGSGTSRRKAAALVLAAVCILLACIVAYVVEEQRNMQADVVDIEDIAADSVDVSGARKFDFETGW